MAQPTVAAPNPRWSRTSRARAARGTLIARNPRKTASTTGASPVNAEGVPIGRTDAGGKIDVMSCQGASLWIEIFPTGILSTKDALDDGNAYDSAAKALR